MNHPKFATKARIAPALDTIATPNLTFYRVAIDGSHNNMRGLNQSSENLNECTELDDEWRQLSDTFPRSTLSLYGPSQLRGFLQAQDQVP